MGRHRTEHGGRVPKAGADNSKEFHAHLSDAWGHARWTGLHQALLQPSRLVALENAFTLQDLTADSTLQPWVTAGVCRAYKRTQDAGPYPQPVLDAATGLRCLYWLDAASLLPPLLLQAAPGMACLDMCAAPGGKSVLLAQQLWTQGAVVQHQQAVSNPELLSAEAAVAGAHITAALGPAEYMLGAAAAAPGLPELGRRTQGALQQTLLQQGSSPQAVQQQQGGGPGSTLTCNEPDPKRRQRLQAVLQEYLPPAVMAKVRVRGHEGDKYWQRCEAEAYDRVLIDAPCSSDRHILQQSSSNRGIIPAEQWSVNGCKKMADLQLQLLLAGLRCLKVGGCLVYSTCSLSLLENDQLVDRALARVGNAVEVVSPLTDPPSSCIRNLIVALGAESTRHGVICLPDKAGWGPIYACVVRKTAAVVKMSLVAPALLALPQQDHSDASEDEGSPS